MEWRSRLEQDVTQKAVSFPQLPGHLCGIHCLAQKGGRIIIGGLCWVPTFSEGIKLETQERKPFQERKLVLAYVPVLTV